MKTDVTTFKKYNMNSKNKKDGRGLGTIMFSLESFDPSRCLHCDERSQKISEDFYVSLGSSQTLSHHNRWWKRGSCESARSCWDQHFFRNLSESGTPLNCSLKYDRGNTGWVSIAQCQAVPAANAYFLSLSLTHARARTHTRLRTHQQPTEPYSKQSSKYYRKWRTVQPLLLSRLPRF